MPAANVTSPARSGRNQLGALLLLSVTGYVILALWFPLIPNVTVAPPGDVRSFAPGLLGGVAYAVLVIALFGLFLAAVRMAAEKGMGSRPLLTLVGGTLLLAVPLLMTYPVNAIDIFGYVIRGRIASTYGENPFTAPADRFIGDPFMPLVGEWAGETTPYGPLWEMVASGLTALSGDNLAAGVLLFKLLMLFCFLTAAVLIWKLLPESPSRAASTMLWAWNPGLLLTFIMDGHNDALMLLWLVLGYWLNRRGHQVAGFLVMVLAVVTKPVALLALPFFFVEVWRSLPSGRERVRFGALTFTGSLVIVWLAFLPWAGASGVLQIALYLALRLAREATGGAGFSPAVWIYMTFGGRMSIEAIGRVMQALFVVFSLWLIWRAARGRSSLRGAADIFFGYMATALNYRIWYAVWPFPFLLLDAEGDKGMDTASARRADYRLRVGLWFLVTSQLSVILYGHVRQFFLGGDQTLAHLIGVPFVFALPWFLALVPVRLSRLVHGG